MTGLNLRPQRIAASVAGTLGIVGLLLAAIGTYGVTSYAVAHAQNWHPHGARRRQRPVLGLVLTQGATLARCALRVRRPAASGRL